jgi:hypothetical protein
MNNNPFATHLPVLHALGKDARIRRVLEFGGGDYSTRTFLDREHFPYLERLHTVEVSPDWRTRLDDLLEDPRFDMSDGYLSKLLGFYPLERPDLIFIDDCIEVADRVRTIRMAGELVLGDDAPWAQALVVIHDYEIHEYVQAARQYWTLEYVETAAKPYTGLLARAGTPSAMLFGMARHVLEMERA